MIPVNSINFIQINAEQIVFQYHILGRSKKGFWTEKKLFQLSLVHWLVAKKTEEKKKRYFWNLLFYAVSFHNTHHLKSIGWRSYVYLNGGSHFSMLKVKPFFSYHRSAVNQKKNNKKSALSNFRSILWDTKTMTSSKTVLWKQ